MSRESLQFIFQEAMDGLISKREIDRLSPERAVYQGETLLQIVPASGTLAKFHDGEDYPVLCWCLKEEDWIIEGEPKKIRRVVGMIIIGEQVGLQCIDGPDCHTKFMEYVYS